MTTLNLVVSASADDANSQSNATAAGGTGNVIAADITSILLSPGFHGASNYWYAGCRFLSVTIPQGSTINSATFSMTNDTGYTSPGTIKYVVSCEKHTTAANPITFSTTTGNLSTTNRPRTTANTVWDQKTTPATQAYQAVDITTAVQEVINQAGWTSGWSIVVILDVDATTTSGEWQDYVAKDNSKALPPKLDIVYGGAASTFPPLPAVWRNPLIPQ